MTVKRNRVDMIDCDSNPEAELLLCRDITEVGSLLWDEHLIETILEAAKCRVRIGTIEFPLRTFTNAFHSLLAATKFKQDLLPFDEFRSLFLDTCVHLKDRFADELLDELHKNERFGNLWADLENVVIGSISQQYATTVFRSDSNVTNFSDAFWLASRDRMSKENMTLFSWIANKSEFSCKLDHLLASFIRPELIDVMNQCMRFAHSAYRTRELLVTMANDKELMSRMTCPQSSFDVSIVHSQQAENMNKALRTRLRFFVFTLEQIVSHFRELFAEKVRYVFQTKRDEIVNASSLKEVETAVAEGHRNLTEIVVRTGVRRMVHETMDMFMSMTDEIRLRSVSNTLDLDYLQRCEESVRKTLNTLLSLHASWGNDKDSIFFHLSMTLEFYSGIENIRRILSQHAADVLYVHQHNEFGDEDEAKKCKNELMTDVMDMMGTDTEAAMLGMAYRALNLETANMDVPSDDRMLELVEEAKEKVKEDVKQGANRKYFKNIVKEIRDGKAEEEEMEVMQVQHSRKDPISKKDIVYPVINKKCGHVYDKESIMEFANRKKTIKCAMQGCSETIKIAVLSTIQRQMSATATISPPARELKTSSICGYLHRIEVRSIGLITRRRYWFALCDTTPYLYWYKDSDDVKCIGRVSLSGAAFTYDPKEKGRFEIHSNNEVIVLECSSDKQRNEWMKALQSTRKRSWKAAKSKSDSCLDISSLTGRNSAAVFEEPSSPSPVPPPRSPKPKKRTQIPTNPEESTETPEETAGEDEPREEVGEPEKAEREEAGNERTESAQTPEASTTEWYLNPNGQLNERSLQMPKTIESPESVLKRLADQSIEAPMRAIRRNLSVWKSGSSRQNTGDEPIVSNRKGTVSSVDLTPEEKCIELTDKVTSLEEVVDSLRAALLLAQRNNEALKKIEDMGENNEEMREYLLEKERQVTELHISNSMNARRVRDLEDQNVKLEDTINDLQQSVEAFRESLRTKEELILRMCEEENRDDLLGPATSAANSERNMSLLADANGIVSDVEVPEGILVDVTSIDYEEATRRVLDEENVKDIGELQDLVEGYRTQNQFLNAEIVELHAIIQSLEDREKKLIRQNFDLEACYYQLKSRYLMVLNHFKSPTKPGKIMEPGVLKELLEESARTPRESQQNLTDQLGFYKKDLIGESDDLLDTATFYMKKANDITEATKLEQSEEYMKWLQSWDSFLVNNTVSRQVAIMSSPDLKTLIRTGVPPAYRGRVWKSIVTHWVKDAQAELGNGYYGSMLKKASAKKQDGSYDAAIKQIDLDLARTLPTNKLFDEPDSANIEKLRNVLYAFRYHNSHVGYCQGLNRLAAIALLYLDEQDAFWFLIACVEHLQPEGYYTSSLIGAVADQKVLRDLVAEKLPKLAAHLRSLEVDLSLFALCWFLTCFVDVLPHSIYLTIFDAFLYEGNKVLFRFALALLKICEPHVLQCKTIGTVHQCLSKAQDHITDFKSLAQVAFNELNPFPQKSIETKRQLYVSQLKDTGHCM
ncbi:unnamed protein product [Caenorhabditis sp. 36 PRJEB53466]|nr:unnamed protein product [Caenorhabditis sp. 36 PRJEB53466]